jgi:hypothetical protein
MCINAALMTIRVAQVRKSARRLKPVQVCQGRKHRILYRVFGVLRSGKNTQRPAIEVSAARFEQNVESFWISRLRAQN